MNQALRKALLFGIGVYHLTREKVEEFISELQAEGTLTPEEGKKVVEEVLKRAESEGSRLSQEVEKAVRKAIKDFGIDQKAAAVKKEITKTQKKTSGKKPVAKKKPLRKDTKES